MASQARSHREPTTYHFGPGLHQLLPAGKRSPPSVKDYRGQRRTRILPESRHFIRGTSGSAAKLEQLSISDVKPIL